MFYIYYGYVSSDHYDSSEYPTYRINECQTEEQVLAFKKEFEEDYLHDDCDNVIFRVFEGKERTLKPKAVIQSYELD